MNAKKILAILFAVVLVSLAVITAFSKKASFSEEENRNLSTFPSFSLSAINDKSFMNGFDSYVSDHFFGRNFWVNLKSSLELLTLKKENNSILLTSKNSLVEDLKKPDERRVNMNISGIEGFAKNNPDAKVFVAIAPTALDIYYKDSILQWMDDYNKKNGIILMTTHEEKEILSADRCLVMHEGHMLEFSKDEIAMQQIRNFIKTE